MVDEGDTQPTRYAPDWYETAIWLATNPSENGGEVRLYRTADGRYFRFHLEPVEPAGVISEYPTGQEQQVSDKEAREVYSQSSDKLVTEAEAFPLS